MQFSAVLGYFQTQGNLLLCPYVFLMHLTAVLAVAVEQLLSGLRDLLLQIL